jgi:peptidoglycan/xylan/chitin deacetylase (PgdA/CDA1 family)
VSPGVAIVLTYHRVRAGRDPLGQCVDPTRFAEHVGHIQQLAQVVPLSALDRPSSARRIALTFDDGYADNATVAAPILADAGLPATFFIPSRTLSDGGEYWWDRLEHVHLDRPPAATTVDVAPGGRRVRIDVRTEAGRLRSLKALNRRLRPLSLAAVEPIVAEVARQLDADPHPCCDSHGLMDTAGLTALGAHPLFEIGSHGVSHVMLSALPAHEQERELRASRTALEAAVERPVTSLAYPFGTAASFSEGTIELAEESGYQRACSNLAGQVDVRRGRFRLARHMVYNWTGDELVRRLTSWFAAA